MTVEERRQKKGVGNNNNNKKSNAEKKVIFMAGIDLGPGAEILANDLNSGEAGLNINVLINPVILS